MYCALYSLLVVIARDLAIGSLFNVGIRSNIHKQEVQYVNEISSFSVNTNYNLQLKNLY